MFADHVEKSFLGLGLQRRQRPSGWQFHSAGSDQVGFFFQQTSSQNMKWVYIIVDSRNDRLQYIEARVRMYRNDIGTVFSQLSMSEQIIVTLRSSS